MPQIYLFRTSLAHQVYARAMSTVFRSGSHLDLEIHILCSTKDIYLKHKNFNIHVTFEKEKELLPSKFWHKPTKSEKIWWGFFLFVPPKVICLFKKERQIRKDFYHQSKIVGSEKYIIVMAVCIVVAPLGMPIFVAHVYHGNSLPSENIQRIRRQLFGASLETISFKILKHKKNKDYLGNH